MIEWYTYKNFWRRGDADGDDSPQDRDDGTGDIIFNTMSKIENDLDNTLWGVDSFIKCCKLLKDRKRWPNEFNTGDEAPNMIAYHFYNLLGIKKYKHRSQGRMTRDPFIATGAAYAMLMRYVKDSVWRFKIMEAFEEVKLPWYLYRAKTWRWWRRLKGYDKEHFVKRLSYLRASGTVHIYQALYHDDFYNDTP